MIRVANAPCSWGVLEFEATSSAPIRSAGYRQVLDEIRQAGYDGTELGDWGFMPTDPAALAGEVAARELALIGAFVPIALADASAHREGAERAVRTARLLRDAGQPSSVIVLSDDNGTVARREQNAGRIRPEHGLTDAEWTVFAAGAELVARAVNVETGLRTVFHPHCGGYVETVDEIDTLMSRTSDQLVGLCLDTGHITYAGGDPLDVLQRHASRVWHVHFKDCDPQVADKARRDALGYLSAVRSQLFCELGGGSVDFAAIVDALSAIGYDGWIVIEQDVFPGCGTPLESARRSREFLTTLGL